MKGGQDILFGVHSVREALRAGKRRFHALLIADGRSRRRLSDIESLAAERGIGIEPADSGTLDRMARSSNHQGVVARTSILPVPNAMEFLDRLDHLESDCFLLIVENMEDPHNLGALIRTALCVGVDAVMVPRDRAVSPSPTVSRTSAGAMEHAAIYAMTNTATVLNALKQKGVWVFGLDAEGETPLFQADLKGPVALVVGGEHKGIRPLVQKACDVLVSIPNRGAVNSLNASVAGGMAMYEILRQRHGR